MAVKREDLEVETATAQARPIQLLTENGFSIVRAAEIGGASPSPPGTYVFVVRDPQGSELDVIVGVDRAATNEVTLASRGVISSESTYWIVCAERHLADYLWANDDYPPGATLRVEMLTPRDLNLAHRWKIH